MDRDERVVHNIFEKEKKGTLTGLDYMLRPLVELQSHPDFSPHAYRIIHAISEKTTKEIERINLI